MDRGAWQSTDHEVAKSWPRLSDSHTYIHILEWVAIPSSRGSAYPEIEPSSLMSPVFAGRLFPTEPSREPG